MLILSLPVTFQDCSRGKVRFEVGQTSDFRVSEAGEVYTSRHLSLGQGRAIEGVLYAQDLHNKQVWKTKLYLHAESQQVEWNVHIPSLHLWKSNSKCYHCLYIICCVLSWDCNEFYWWGLTTSFIKCWVFIMQMIMKSFMWSVEIEVRHQMSLPHTLHSAVFAGEAWWCNPDSAATGDFVSMAQRDCQGRWDCKASEERLGHSSDQCPWELTRTVPRGPRQSKAYTKKVCVTGIVWMGGLGVGLRHGNMGTEQHFSVKLQLFDKDVKHIYQKLRLIKCTRWSESEPNVR